MGQRKTKKELMDSNSSRGSLHYSERELLEVLIDIRDMLYNINESIENIN